MPITTMQGEMNASVWRRDGDEGSDVGDIHMCIRKKSLNQSYMKLITS